jgi:hypothetical protein
MKLKKVDSAFSNFYGAAERYVSIHADFEIFIKRQFGTLSELRDLDVNKIVKTYSLGGIVFGNYVTQEERYYFLFKISKELELLAKIKGSKNLGLNKLIIAFGADGKPRSLAHFNAAKGSINLNRGKKHTWKDTLMGENSFIHEYAHFLDFEVGSKDNGININFASQAVLDGQYFAYEQIKVNAKKANDKTLLFKDFTDIPFANIEYTKKLKKARQADYYLLPHEMFARLFEATVSELTNKEYPAYRKYLLDRYNRIQYLPSSEIRKIKGLKKKLSDLLNSI